MITTKTPALALKRTYYDSETNQHYFMDYNSKYAKAQVLFTAPAYYNTEDDETVIDFEAKTEVMYYLLNNNYSAVMEARSDTAIVSPTTLKRLTRKCRALVRATVPSAKASAKLNQMSA